MELSEVMKQIQKDKNIFRVYENGKRLVKRTIGMENVPQIVDYCITITGMLLMEKYHITKEDADRVLSIDGKDFNNVVRIKPDNTREVFCRLLDEYENNLMFCKVAKMSTSSCSLFKTGKRKLKVDKLIEICRNLQRNYIVEV